MPKRTSMKHSSQRELHNIVQNVHGCLRNELLQRRGPLEAGLPGAGLIHCTLTGIHFNSIQFVSCKEEAHLRLAYQELDACNSALKLRHLKCHCTIGINQRGVHIPATRDSDEIDLWPPCEATSEPYPD